MNIASTVRIGVGFLCLLACVLWLGTGKVSALSASGPDRADYGGGAGDVFAYIVSDPRSPSAGIPNTSVNFYFTNNTTAKSVTIRGGDICTDALQSAPSSGGNYRDRPFGAAAPPSGRVATMFYLRDSVSAVRVSPVMSGLTNAANGCYNATRTIAINNAWLKYDPAVNRYVITFWAQFVSSFYTGTDGQNRFELTLTGGGIVSPVADPARTTDAFGIAREFPYSGFRNYSIPFGSDCTVPAGGKNVSMFIYDDDNGDPAIQGGRFMTMQLERYNAAGTFQGTVPLSFSGGSVTNNGGNNYTLSTGSRRGVYINFNAQQDARYRWRINGVFYINILQFQLPFDSIFFLTGCSSPPVTNCTPPTAVPSRPEVGTPVTLAERIILGSPAPLPPYQLRLVVTRMAGGSTATFNTSGVNGSFGFTPPLSGRYDTVWTFTAPGVTRTCTGFFDAVAKPYFKVYNGDAQGGARFEPTCAATGSSYRGVAGFNKGSSGAYAGAGAQIAVIAAQAIREFASAQLAAGPIPPDGLAFANDDPLLPYGGDFVNEPCIPDYWSLAQGIVSGTPYNVSGAPLAVGSSRDIFVEGDAYIENNILTTGSGSWSLGLMPYFRLIVHRGNLYIKNTVSQLDGLYIAIPDGGVGGTIYTCSLNGGVPTEDEIANACNTKLTVNGSFIASEVKLLRTYRTLSQSGAPQDNSPATSNAAEVFVYTPEVWLANPQTNPPINARYDAITSLPPIL